MIKRVKKQLINTGITVKCQVKKFAQDQKGELIGTIGMMAIMATVLVVIHGLLTGWLPGFVNDIFSNLEGLL